MVISGCEQRQAGVGERLRNKRHDKRDRKLNETKAKSVVSRAASGGRTSGELNEIQDLKKLN